MKLSLTYHPKTKGDIAGAFIKGDKPDIWLKEMSQWGIEWSEMICFFVPTSIQSTASQGIFAIFKKPVNGKNILHPYTQIGRKLLIPLQSELFPPVFPEELDRMLTWDYQVFHPEVGLLGFSLQDQIHLADILDFSPPSEATWDHAVKGPPAFPPLTEITLNQPSPEEVLEAFQEKMDSKSLKDLLGDEDDSMGGMFRNLGINTLKGALSLSDQLKDWIDEQLDDGDYSPDDKPGLLNLFDDWANRQINNLQDQRDREINRLLELFKKNPNEALRFALPLNSPYRGRGQGKSGNQLPYQNTDFNLHKLGGGWAADGWDLSNDQYRQLQNLYHEEAKKSLASGEFRRAAYIYAHLLGDYNAAANALEQGKFYREAAVIYKDHLKKTDAAAACLEKGGLIPEAIDLYLELNHHEKAGDLSLLIGRKQAAQNLYQTAFEKAINRDDYLDAVRILKEKLNQKEKIPEVLLKGWQISSRKEACLNQYFDFLAEKDPDSLPESVREIFDKHTRPDQRIAFLNVLKETKRKYDSPEFTKTTEGIVFEVISHDISQGNLGTIEFLAAFIPQDKLMFSDISRYKYLHKNHIPKLVVQSELLGLPLQRYSLDPTINWMAIDKNYQSMIAVGMKNNLLYAAVSKEDQTKYYSWPNQISKKTKWKLFSNPFQQSSYIILAGHPDPGIISFPIGEGILPRPLELTHYNWMTHLTYSICVREDSIVTLSQNQGNNRILTYHFDSNLFSSFPIEFHEGLQPRKDFLPHRMQSIRENYYTANGHTLFCFYGEGVKKGKFHYLHFSSLIKDFIAIPGPQISFIVCTEEGCFTVEESSLGFHLTSEIFAQQTEIVDIQRITLSSIVIAGRNEILLYQIYTDVQKEPELIKHFWVQENIQAVMPTKQRGQITVFTEEGEVVFY